MEDLIYIIIGVLWLVFTFYTASKKKKQKQQEQANPSQSSQKPPGKNILEELFGKTELFEEKAKPVHPYSSTEVVFDDFESESFENSDSVTFEDEYEDKGISSIETVGNKYYSEADKVSFQELVKQAQSHRISETDSMDFHIEDHKDKIIKKDFNLRKALIYQAILERPYG